MNHVDRTANRGVASRAFMVPRRRRTAPDRNGIEGRRETMEAARAGRAEGGNSGARLIGPGMGSGAGTRCPPFLVGNGDKAGRAMGGGGRREAEGKIKS